MEFEQPIFELKFGYELPVGTVVYYADTLSTVVNSVQQSTIGSTSNKITRYPYIYKPSDGLYASFSTRRIWEQNFCLHPHCTLFEMLHEKLRI